MDGNQTIGPDALLDLSREEIEKKEALEYLLSEQKRFGSNAYLKLLIDGVRKGSLKPQTAVESFQKYVRRENPSPFNSPSQFPDHPSEGSLHRGQMPPSPPKRFGDDGVVADGNMTSISTEALSAERQYQKSKFPELTGSTARHLDPDQAFDEDFPFGGLQGIPAEQEGCDQLSATIHSGLHDLDEIKKHAGLNPDQTISPSILHSLSRGPHSHGSLGGMEQSHAQSNDLSVSPTTAKAEDPPSSESYAQPASGGIDFSFGAEDATGSALRQVNPSQTFMGDIEAIQNQERSNSFSQDPGFSSQVGNETQMAPSSFVRQTASTAKSKDAKFVNPFSVRNREGTRPSAPSTAKERPPYTPSTSEPPASIFNETIAPGIAPQSRLNPPGGQGHSGTRFVADLVHKNDEAVATVETPRSDVLDHVGSSSNRHITQEELATSETRENRGVSRETGPNPTAARTTQDLANDASTNRTLETETVDRSEISGQQSMTSVVDELSEAQLVDPAVRTSSRPRGSEKVDILESQDINSNTVFQPVDENPYRTNPEQKMALETDLRATQKHPSNMALLSMPGNAPEELSESASIVDEESMAEQIEEAEKLSQAQAELAESELSGYFQAPTLGEVESFGETVDGGLSEGEAVVDSMSDRVRSNGRSGLAIDSRATHGSRPKTAPRVRQALEVDTVDSIASREGSRTLTEASEAEERVAMTSKGEVEVNGSFKIDYDKFSVRNKTLDGVMRTLPDSEAGTVEQTASLAEPEDHKVVGQDELSESESSLDSATSSVDEFVPPDASIEESESLGDEETLTERIDSFGRGEEERMSTMRYRPIDVRQPTHQDGPIRRPETRPLAAAQGLGDVNLANIKKGNEAAPPVDRSITLDVDPGDNAAKTKGEKGAGIDLKPLGSTTNPPVKPEEKKAESGEPPKPLQTRIGRPGPPPIPKLPPIPGTSKRPIRPAVASSTNTPRPDVQTAQIGGEPPTLVESTTPTKEAPNSATTSDLFTEEIPRIDDHLNELNEFSQIKSDLGPSTFIRQSLVEDLSVASMDDLASVVEFAQRAKSKSPTSQDAIPAGQLTATSIPDFLVPFTELSSLGIKADALTGFLLSQVDGFTTVQDIADITGQSCDLTIELLQPMVEQKVLTIKS